MLERLGQGKMAPHLLGPRFHRKKLHEYESVMKLNGSFLILVRKFREVGVELPHKWWTPK